MTNTQEYENHLDEEEPRWFAIYTPYKREKIVVEHLKRKEITAYLPIQRLTRRYTRKIKIVELPLISGYVFVKIVKEEYIRVLETENVLRFVKFSNNLLAIPEQEIRMMRQVLGEGIEVNASKTTFYEGDEVEIIAGNLTGMKGTLVSIGGKKQFLVDLNFLGYTLQMTIDPVLLRRLKVQA